MTILLKHAKGQHNWIHISQCYIEFYLWWFCQKEGTYYGLLDYLYVTYNLFSRIMGHRYCIFIKMMDVGFGAHAGLHMQVA